ncbi:MAG: cobalamin biosynthesis protein CobQ [Isosphaeraceae bacterium]
MREVDHALARVFPLRPETERGASVPPPPHVSVRREPKADREPEGVREVTVEAASPRPPVAWPALVRLLGDTYPDRFTRLADVLIAARERSGTRVVWFTSCHRSEGCTTLVMTLARTLATRPWRTLLVDADLASPTIGRQLALNPKVGLEGVVTRGAATSDALIESPIDGLTFLPMIEPPSHPRRFFSDPAWPRTVARLRREFDLILIDGGPLFHGYGSSRIPTAVDAAVLVRNRTLTTTRASNRAKGLLESGGVPLLGMAETFTG